MLNNLVNIFIMFRWMDGGGGWMDYWITKQNWMKLFLIPRRQSRERKLVINNIGW